MQQSPLNFETFGNNFLDVASGPEPSFSQRVDASCLHLARRVSSQLFGIRLAQFVTSIQSAPE